MVSSVLGFFFAGLAAALCLMPPARWLATAMPKTAHARQNRWSRRPVGKLGGLAMAVALGLVLTLGGLVNDLWPVVMAAACMVGLGFFDDLHPVGPIAKFAGQIGVTVLFLLLLPSYSITGERAVDLPLGFFWIIGLSNAFNLLDNMDGLAAGIAAIAAAFLAAALILSGGAVPIPLVLALVTLTGVTIGFLVYNFPPASIFMGDSGSHLLGFVIAASALLALPSLSTGTMVPAAVTTLFVVVIPIFDTTFVTITRVMSGRSITVGGHDHTSHRLVRWGLGERRAVLALYGLAIIGGAIGLGVRTDAVLISGTLAMAYAGALLWLGIRLARVPASHSGEDP